MWKRTLFRPAEALAIFLLAACALSVVGLGLLASRGRSRLELIRARVEHTNHILGIGLSAQQSLLAHRQAQEEVDPEVATALRREVSELAASGLVLDPENSARLRRLVEVLGSEPRLSRERLVQVVAVLNRVLESETAAQAELWQRTTDDASAEIDLVIGISVVLPLLSVVAFWFGRRVFVKPLADLRLLLTQLASGERRQVADPGIHPVLAPLFANYNQLVTRLELLEREHESHAQRLEDRIREATATLLEQQATLARAERLAAVGETAASLTHELRNPLAGIQMSLANLRADAEDSDVIARLDVVRAEIERLTRLVNDSLSAVRHAPEPLTEVQLWRLAEDLLTLLRYQVPPSIELVNAIAEGVTCTVPRDRVRQALLNLVLNSVHALDGGPGSVTISGRRRDGRLELVVEDDGPGLPEELLQVGIRSFVSRTPQGTGLGLAMVRRLAVDLGGRVHLENREPRGARVRLELGCNHD